MAIEFACPKCQRRYKIKDELAGRNAKCLGCQQVMKIPTPAASPDLDELQLDSLLDDVAVSQAAPAVTSSAPADDDDEFKLAPPDDAQQTKSLRRRSNRSPFQYDDNQPEAYDRAWEAENAKATEQVAALSEKDIQAQIETFEAKFEAEFEADAPGAVEATGGLMKLFFSTMFSPMDGLFILLAVGTAFKLGSGESAD